MLQQLLKKIRGEERGDTFKQLARNLELRISKIFPNYEWGMRRTNLGTQLSLVEPKHRRYQMHMRFDDKIIVVYYHCPHYADLMQIVEVALTDVKHERSEIKEFYTSFKVLE